LTPRAFAAASAALVRSEIARRSSSATHRKPVCVRHVRGGESNTRALKPEQEVGIASETIELRDHQGRLPHAAFGERSGELQTIASLAAFDLDKFRQRRRAEAR
jgi:hypothetical protein